MDAGPLLRKIAVALRDSGLEAVLIGNAAAALQGAPVTTLDFDFLFRAAPANLRKLKSLARRLGATILRPYHSFRPRALGRCAPDAPMAVSARSEFGRLPPVSSLYRVVNDDIGMQIDFMTTIHAIRSFAALRARAHPLDLDGATLLVASLDDIIKSKRVAGRPRDAAVLPVLEATRAAARTTKRPGR